MCVTAVIAKARARLDVETVDSLLWTIIDVAVNGIVINFCLVLTSNAASSTDHDLVGAGQMH